MATVRISISEYAQLVKSLKESGFDFILIGGAYFDLMLKRGFIEKDLDLFALSPDPFFEEERYTVYARERGLEVSQTWLGTPRLVDSGGFAVEFYQNLMEFEMPPSFIDSAREKRLGGVQVRVLDVEHNILLKARAGLVEERHLEELVKLVKSGGLRYDRGRVRELLGEFEENWQVLERILSEKGII